MGSLGPDFPSSDPPPPQGGLDSSFRPLDPEEFRRQAHLTVDYIADYYKTIEQNPVLSQVNPGYLHSRSSGLPKTAPYEGEGLEEVLGDVGKFILPGLTHWLSPNFFGFFPATVSTAAFVGEMLCAGFNTVGFNWLASPAATELEMVVMDWLADMLKLPPSFMFSGTGGGVLHGTTSEAIMCTLVAARDHALASLGHTDDYHRHDYISKLVVYASDQTHSTFHKACTLVGILPCNIRLLPTTPSSGFSLSPSSLLSALSSDSAAGLIPLYLCATVGTTSTTAVDPLTALLDAVEPHRATLWVHVDAAYAGAACICPEFRPHLDGVERVDSLSVAPHKWLLTGLDCCCLWVKHPVSLVKALRTNPEYLKNELSESDSVVDYKDWQIGTGRRFRSLRLWLVLRSYGVRKLQEHIRSDVRMARVFEGLVRSDGQFEVVIPVRFGLVCFRLRGSEEGNRELLERINETGQVYMTHTVAGGVYMLRFAVGATLTEERHVVEAWKVIKEKADRVLAAKNEWS